MTATTHLPGVKIDLLGRRHCRDVKASRTQLEVEEGIVGTSSSLLPLFDRRSLDLFYRPSFPLLVGIGLRIRVGVGVPYCGRNFPLEPFYIRLLLLKESRSGLGFLNWSWPCRLLEVML